MPPAHVRTFRSRARALISAQSDLLRSAARIAADRPRALTAEGLLLGLRCGFAAGFDVAVGRRVMPGGPTSCSRGTGPVRVLGTVEPERAVPAVDEIRMM